jgi:gluconate kinase
MFDVVPLRAFSAGGVKLQNCVNLANMSLKAPFLTGQGRKHWFSTINKILTHQPITTKTIACKALNLILF